MTKQTEKHYCEKWVWNKDADSDCPCDNNAKYFRDGIWYCWQHDPLREKEKLEARMQLHKIERQRREEEERRRKAEVHYCEHITTEYLETHQGEEG